MKITLSYKSYFIKASSVFILIFLLIISPKTARAGFLGDLFASVMGQNTEAENLADNINKTEHNSQNVPLLTSDSSIDPDVKNTKENKPISITEEGLLSSENTPLALDPAGDLEKNASTSKIDVYIVKKGDTLKSIAKQFKVTESNIIYSNMDIKKAELTKVGQLLVILPVKSIPEKDKQVEKIVKTVKKNENVKIEPVVKEELEVKQDIVPQTKDTPSISKTIVTNDETKTEEAPTPILDSQTTKEDKSSGQPIGTIVGNYIWPVPAGVGRVSQGLHADQAYDFAAPTGTPIYAVQSGTVLIAHPTGYNGGYGRYIVINFDDGRQAIFGHMSKVLAKAGDAVEQGDIIGYVGSTGRSTGPHVHMGFRGSLGNPYLGLKVNSKDIILND